MGLLRGRGSSSLMNVCHGCPADPKPNPLSKQQRHLSSRVRKTCQHEGLQQCSTSLGFKTDMRVHGHAAFRTCEFDSSKLEQGFLPPTSHGQACVAG